MRLLKKLHVLLSVASLGVAAAAHAAPTPVECWDNRAGGNGGSSYFTGWSDTTYLARIEVKYGSYVDSITFTWCQENFPGQPICTAEKIGGSGGPNTGVFDMDWQHGERLVILAGRAGTFLDAVQFISNQSRTSNVFGGTGGQQFNMVTSAGTFFNDFWGTAGTFVDSIAPCEFQ